MHALKNVNKLVIKWENEIDRKKYKLLTKIEIFLKIFNEKINFPDEKRQDYPEHLVLDFDNFLDHGYPHHYPRM